jgi:hypothetical protein
MPGYKEDLDESSESRYAAEWGLAALLMGGVLAIIAPVTLIFNLMFWLQGRRVIAPQDMALAHKAGIVGVGFIAVLCLASLAFGIKAWRAASATFQPAGLAVAGTLVSLLALVLWIITGADLIMILTTFAG